MPVSWPKNCFTHDLWVHIADLVKVCVAQKFCVKKVRIRSGHYFAHAMTAQLSWHVQNCDLIGSLESELELMHYSTRFQLLTHKLFVKWVSVSPFHSIAKVWYDPHCGHSLQQPNLTDKLTNFIFSGRPVGFYCAWWCKKCPKTDLSI